jgi:diguanylate cyclase (GGDEF)-like protein
MAASAGSWRYAGANGLNRQATLSIAVLTSSEDDVELVNKTLRDAGHPARCIWVRNGDMLATTLSGTPVELLILNCDRYADSVRQVVKQKHAYQPEVPTLAMQLDVDEPAILEAMKQGASDLVSIRNRERLQVVFTRELRACRVERALNSTLVSATTYRKQLYDYMEGSSNAIAYVQEGIITNVNRAWLSLFHLQDKNEAVGLPLMDNFETESQAAVKGAIIATMQKKWQPGEKLDARARLDGNKAEDVCVDFQLAQFDDGDHVQVRISLPEKPQEEPTKLVHDALKRDPTTLFFHRTQFLERITKRLASKPKSGLHVLVYIKPDDFSKISGKVGLIASEEVMAQLAELVRKRLHPRDVAGRFEGTVIMALLERGSRDDAEVWANQLVERVARTEFDIGGTKVGTTCTVGVCPVSGAFENMDDFVTAAAHAHAKGKSEGGNRVALNDDLDVDTKLRRHDEIWVRRIKGALMEKRFRLAQLPIAGLRNDSIKMVDTLVRMLDEQGEPILPSEFLPAAERNNLLKTIDRWMISTALEYCTREDADRVFVRLSAQSLRDASLTGWLKTELTNQRIEPTRLCLQVAEKDAARFIKEARATVGRLRKLGVAFALEHYGVDKGRLQILELLKPDYIKIDGELMHSVLSDTEMQQKVREVVAEASKRDIETIAERVENANAMAVLFQIGVHYMQGHYVHEPEVVLQERSSAVHPSLEVMASG